MRFDECRLTLRVRPNDLDSLGHVNNATVIEYLEAGRWAWMEQHGLRHNTRVLPVVLRLEVDYRREILPQEIRVHTVLEAPEQEELEEDETYGVFFRQQVWIEGGLQLAVEARLRVAFIDAQERSLRTLQGFLASARG
jgi:acyl-CoA thioester hydrolase